MRFWANGFCSELLPGWVDRSTITLMGPTAPDGFAANLVVVRQFVPRGSTAASFGREQVRQLSQEFEVHVQDERTTRYNGRDLFQHMHALRVGERLVQQVQTYLVHDFPDGTVGFVITGSASPDAFDEAMPMFKRFVEGFEIFEEDPLTS